MAYGKKNKKTKEGVILNLSNTFSVPQKHTEKGKEWTANCWVHAPGQAL